MYEQHFGLKARPFGSNAEGAGVFVGPRQAKTISALQKALSIQDAVITVTGPVGSGKTTIVSRALDSLPGGRMAAWVGRMQLQRDEVLELLLAGFGIGKGARGTIRQFAAFRRTLQEKASAGVPVLIVVEDAQRIGIDGLVELEALTASDSGDGAGANIILMGQAGLADTLSDPDLARLKQRVRLRQTLAPYSGAEVQGYLKHCVREAGGNYDLIFDPDVADLIAAASEGIPRVINTLCEAALGAAMEDHTARITSALMAQVAQDTLGFDASIHSSAAPFNAGTATNDASSAEDVDWENAEYERPPKDPVRLDDATTHDVIVESGSYTSPRVDDAEEPSVALTAAANDELQPDPAPQNDSATAERAEDVSAADAIPALIDDTQPELRKLPESETDDPAETDTDEASFDLDAALSVETEDTNVMRGLTPDLDAMVADSASGKTTPEQTLTDPASAAESETAPDSEMSADLREVACSNDAVEPLEPAQDDGPEENELPTLSDSMRIDINGEAKLAQAEETDSPTEPLIGEDAATVDRQIEQDVPESDESVAATVMDSDGDLSVETSASANDQQTIEPEHPDSESSAPASPDAGTDNIPAAHDFQPEQKDIALAADPAQPATIEKTDSSQADVVSLDDALLPDADFLETGDGTEDQAADEVVAAAKPTEEPPLPLPEIPQAAVDEAGAPQITDDVLATPRTADPTDVEIFNDLEPVPDFDTAALEFEVPAKKASTESEAPAPDAAVSTPDPGTISMPELAITNKLDQSRNDIDALEAALEAAKQGKISAPPPIELEAPVADDRAEMAESSGATDDLPEITLDTGPASKPAETSVLDKHVKEIGSANSLEEFSDAMAETLFGNAGFDELAAAVVANPPDEKDLQLASTDSPVMLDQDEAPHAANDIADTSTANTPENVQAPKTPETVVDKVAGGTSDAKDDQKAGKVPLPDVDINASAAMRIDLLAKMKENVARMASENVEIGDARNEAGNESDGATPEPIESQINTSITQTLEALNVAKMAEAAATEEKTEKKRGGLFSRFRRSS